jgi:hypothetical protein
VTKVLGEVDPRHPALPDQPDYLVPVGERRFKLGEKLVH